jgi:hypothetical protein
MTMNFLSIIHNLEADVGALMMLEAALEDPVKKTILRFGQVSVTCMATSGQPLFRVEHHHNPDWGPNHFGRWAWWRCV